MKRRIIAFLLTGSMLLQCTCSVMAADIINEDIPAVIAEEKAPNIVEEQVEEISLYGADVYEENVGDFTLSDEDIAWGKGKADSYWNDFPWDKVQWDILSGMSNEAFPRDWADKVEWDKVNWKGIDWYGYSTCPSYWEQINWDKVDWSKMFWTTVDWTALKKLVEASKISVSFTYSDVKDNKLTTPVTQIADTTYWSILSSCVTIKIKGANAADDKYTAIPTDAYTIIVEKTGENYTLKGIWNKPWGSSDMYASDDFFELDKKRPLIVNGVVKYPLTKSDYWTITVDDSNCTFADSGEPLPKVTIESKDGVMLEEIIDYTIKDVTQKGQFSCGEHTLKITAEDDSKKVGSGSVERQFTVHYADIKDFYKLKGIPTEMTVKDHIPYLTDDVNGDGKTKEQLDGYIYLEPLNNEALKAGRLPSIMDDLSKPYGSELFNSDGYLKVEYRYDSAVPSGIVWSKNFDWDDWRNNHTSNIVHIKVSVDETVEGAYKATPSGYIPPRYLKGNIYASMRLVPYSLAEVNDVPGEPKTEPTLGRTWYLAAVNPITTPDGEKGEFKSVTDGEIQSVTYNGKEQEPGFQVSLFDYSTRAVGGSTRPEDYAYNTYSARNYSSKITYEDNVDAGKGKAIVSFSGEFTGSITREFTIEPKSIADEHVKIQAQDFLYDGKPHTPILTVTDTAINNKVLQEGTDYTVTPSGNITSPGTVTATIEGINNYTGTQTVQYKIVPTSTVVVGTKLEQVADIQDKIDDQKYTGQPVTPEVVITGKNSSFKLAKDKDYKVSYLNNIGPGTAYAVVEGIGSYGGTYIIPFNINGADISKATVTVNGTYTYTGKAITPSVTVKVGDKIIEPADYEIKATNNINAGTAKFTVTGRNNCTGTTGESTFKIKKANQKLSITKEQAKALLIRNTNANTYKIKVLGAKTKLSYKVSNKKIASVDSAGMLSFKHVCGKTFVTVSAPASANYNAAALKINFAVKPATPKIKITALNKGFRAEATVIRDITGYQVGYSTSKSFPTSRTIKKQVDTTKALKMNYTGLSSKRNYYVRVRAYKIASDGTKYWGNWTKAKRITAK